MTTILAQWAKDHGVSAAALADLQNRYTVLCQEPLRAKAAENSESYVQSEVRLVAPMRGYLLFRNNVGALTDDRGVPVRYGLANDNKLLNEKIKSADLIGVRKVLITPDMVGTVIGQFASVEVKKREWKPSEDPKREKAQKEWAMLIQAWGACSLIISDKEGLK